MLQFEEFPKIPRLKREVVITEKIDGTNAQILLVSLDNEQLLEAAKNDPQVLKIFPGGGNGDNAVALKAGSRNRYITPEADNFGFARWVLEHADELASLGEGRHFGEWYGAGIGRRYGLTEKRFALFNVARWNDQNPNRPACCQVVPILARGEAINDDDVMANLLANGSQMVPGFLNPEGIIVYHSASRQMYKRTFEQDGGKWVR
jgi:hypothetical protein